MCRYVCCKCCKSPKTWCRFACLLCSLAHGVLFGVVAALTVLNLTISDFFPIVSSLQRDHFPGWNARKFDLLVTITLVGLNFAFAIPYVVVASVGTRSSVLLIVVFFVCMVELTEWIALFIFALISFGYETSDWNLIAQWLVLSGMIVLLCATWTTTLLTWKRRRYEDVVAVHTARLISQRKNQNEHQSYFVE